MKPQIVNIINFVRGVEPRQPAPDLCEPVREQLRLLRENRLPGTFLLQYDALLRNDIVSLLKSSRNGALEIGGWLEVVQPLAEAAGIEWKGRFPFDWHTNTGFPIGYIPEERERIADAFMKKFREIFGQYPRSVGSWFIDAHTLSYLYETYGITASCNCKDQWGTDGYTLWGGYYNQAYYPSRYNSFVPAQTLENQIGVPVFRMLGSDPIVQYDRNLDEEYNPADRQGVATLEPVCEQFGGSPEWVKWYMKENFNGHCLSFGYTQAGQENSFGWDAMKSGLEFQLPYIAQKALAGELSVQTLEETGRWFRSRYELTPPSAVAALSDWEDKGRSSVWYSSRFYRTNLYVENGRLFIRDLFLFDERNEEPYLEQRCTQTSCTYENYPVMDGNRWSGNSVRAGIYPALQSGENLRPMCGGPLSVEEEGDEALIATWPAGCGGFLKIRCSPRTISFEFDRNSDPSGFALFFSVNRKAEIPQTTVSGREITFHRRGRDYSVVAKTGSFSADGTHGIVIRPEQNKIVLDLGYRN